jgi:CelD/BcsL family acetyltransferase involved in cellulose biosynthesis
VTLARQRSGDSLLDTPLAGYSVEFIDRLGRLDEIGAEIDALQERTGAPASARWAALRTGLRHQPSAWPWCVLVRSGMVLAAAALGTADLHHGTWAVRSAMHPDEPGWLAAIDAAAGDALAAALARELQRLRLPWSLEWRHLPADDRTVPALCRLLRPSTTLPSASDPQLVFDPRTRAMGSLSTNTRSAVSRARKRIAAAGRHAAMDWMLDAGEIEACLGAVVDIHQRRNRQLRGVAGLDDPHKRALFEDTVRAHAGAGRARLLTLRLDGRLAAYALCFEASGRLHVYSNMASPDWLQFSPGTLTNAELVTSASHDPGIRVVDWGPGLQRYKLSGARVHVEPLCHLRAWSSTAYRLAWSLGQRLSNG